MRNLLKQDASALLQERQKNRAIARGSGRMAMPRHAGPLQENDVYTPLGT